jgi:hypothetical protein
MHDNNYLMITYAYGASAAETWIRREALEHNGVFAGLVPYIKGTLWYQGESNSR